jgi:hypothetical protein
MWFGEPHPYPEEDHVPDWVCRDKHFNKCYRVQQPSAGSGPTSGCEEPTLANWSAI